MKRKQVYELLKLMRNIVDQEMDFSNFFERYSNDERTDLEDDLIGVSNGFLSEIVHAITGYEIEVQGEVEDLFVCPCCGFKTLTERFDPKEGTGYDICPYCNWEDDGTTDIKLYRSINKGSISDYRNRLHENANRYYINKWMKG